MKLVSAVSVTIFSLFVSFTGVFAWFTTKSKVDSNSTAFTVEKAGEFNFTYKLYYYDNKTKSVVCKDESSSTMDLSLQSFDTSVSETNDTFNNILRFDVDFTGKDTSKTRKMTTKVKCAATTVGSNYSPLQGETATRTFADKVGFKFNYSKTESGTTTTGNYICDNISNIIQFKGFAYSYKIGSTVTKIDSTKTIDFTSNTTVYNTAKNIFNSMSSVSKFVSSTTSKNGEITFDFTGIPGGAESVEYYLEYNYNTDLLNQYIKNNEYLKNREFSEDFDPTEIDLNVTFLKDITELKLSTELA